jgi:hypothetical protein
MMIFENRVLRGIFIPKRDEVTGGWRRLHNEDLHNVYSSPNTVRVIKSRRMRWEGHVQHGIQILVGKFEGKRLIGRHSCR